ncbi:hypothetical protein WA026_005802 [Henosepilachna vigintioctopunctata]|uniref:DNA polymerase theta n=1 Tax=Henosepilachna vigintioctopunctata TaxID=420089 RepID=A0AAW1U2X8_9CUCU
MNDTLDYFELSQIDKFINENLLKVNGNGADKNDSNNTQCSISFDDSVFFESFNGNFSLSLEKQEGTQENKLLSQEIDKLETNLNLADEIDKNNELNLFPNILRNKSHSQLSERDGLGESLSNVTHENLQSPETDHFITNSNFTHEIDENNELDLFPNTLRDVSHSHLTEGDDVSESSNDVAHENLQSYTPVVSKNIQENSEVIPEAPISICDELCIASSQENFTKKKNVESENVDYHLLSSWGLPKLVLNNYEKRNITSMFDWQLECLSKNDIVKEYKNLVYSAPTSAGKTLVAEILAIKCLFERNKKVLFILPFISVVREKMYYFQDIFGSSGKRVEGFMGSYNPPGGFTPVHMAIGTIEKCNSLVNRLLEEHKLEDIGLVIIDEMHLIGDPYRGYLLELLLTKLKYAVSKNSNIKIQIVGMSATLPNLDLLAEWLNAELYTTDFRPIPLHEMVYVNKELYNNEFKLLRRLTTLPELAADTDDVLQLSLETIGSSCSVLIFCPTKNWCENLAQQIAMAFWRIGKSDSDLGKILRNNLDISKITEILEQLRYCPSGLDKVLKNTVAFGVAFHHAGLTMEERDIIEGGFRSGGIKLLIATSTLSSGVNLPARRVIVRSPLFGGRPIDILTYRQMIGRAGRMGIDEEGQSILICQKSDYNTAKSLTQSLLKPVQSCLEDVGKFKRAILEIIASGVASSPDDLHTFEKSTLMYVQKPNGLEEISPVTQVVEFLKNFHFIRLQTLDDGTCKFIPTALGKACLTSSLPPGEGLELFTELEKARQCFVLESELHIIYLVTPYSVCYQWSNMDWMFYLDLWEKLPISMKKVGELVGVRESMIVNATRGKVPESSKLLIHKRFFIALALQELVNEKQLDEVAAKFSCNRGMLQSLQQSASTFAGMVTSFCKQLGWLSVEILISQFQDRLQFGVNRDLLDLMRLPCLNSKQARALYNAGIETLIKLANSDACTIENILHKVVPFENISEREGETHHDFQQRNKMRTVWITGKQGLTEKEAADLILHDAREYLENEMGVKNIMWGLTDDEDKTEVAEAFPSVLKDDQDIPQNNCTLKTQDQICSKNIKADLKTKTDNNVNKNTSNNNIITQCHLNTNNALENKENVLTNKSQDLSDFKYVSKSEVKIVKNLRISQIDKDLKESATSEKCVYTSEPDPVIHKSSESNSNHHESNSNDTNLSCASLSDDDLFHESLEDTITKVSSLTVDNKKRYCQPGISPDMKKIKKTNSCENGRKNELNSNCNEGENSTSRDLSKFNIIDVCKYKKLVHTFCEELLDQTDVVLSLACSKVEENTNKIGMNVNTSGTQKYRYQFQNINVDGIAFTWDGKNVYYLYLETDGCDKKTEFLRVFFEKKKIKVKMFDSKECIIMLNRALGLNISTQIEDPKILDWLLEPDGKEKNIHSMICKYCPEAKTLLSLLQNENFDGSLGMNVQSTIQSRMRSAVEVIITWSLLTSMKRKDYPESLLSNYEIEMAAVMTISKMEIAGIGIDFALLESLISSFKSNLSTIEKKIYSLAGRRILSHLAKRLRKPLD